MIGGDRSAVGRLVVTLYGRPVVTLRVLGTPAPKGSARAFFKAGMKRAVIVKDNDARQRGWDANVRAEAARAVGEREAPPFVETALCVRIEFRLARPAGHWGKGKNAGRLQRSAPAHPRGKPDLDKLARATLDSLTGIVFDDDSRIVRLELIKHYATPGDEGATVTVSEERGASAGSEAT